MKKVLWITALVGLTALVACKKDDPINLNNPNLVSPLNCTPGSVITAQGNFPQGTCQFGQGQNPANNQCITGTPCQGIGGFGNINITSYYNSLAVVSKSVFENFMAEVFMFCQKNNAWGTSNCDYYSNNLELIIESIAPTNGTASGMNSVYATVYAGAPRTPLVNPMSYWPTGNNTGFKLISSNSSFRIEVDSGTLTQDSFNVRLFYKNAEFANGFVTRYR